MNLLCLAELETRPPIKSERKVYKAKCLNCPPSLFVKEEEEGKEMTLGVFMGHSRCGKFHPKGHCKHIKNIFGGVCVCVCVCVHACVRVCVCVCVKERERESI